MEAELPEVHQDHSSARFYLAIDEARETAEQNLAGLVVRIYDISLDGFVWVFGHHRWPVLTGQGGRTVSGDTMAMRRNCPIDEFHSYLQAFYWPRSREMRARGQQVQT